MSLEALKEAFTIPFTVDDVIDAMNEKYDDNFTFVDQKKISIFKKGRMIIANAEKVPGEDIVVQLSNDDDGDRVLEDNYIYMKYRKNIVSVVNDVLTASFGDSYKYVFYAPDSFTVKKTLFPNVTFEQFINDEETLIVVDSVVFCESSNVDITEIEDKVKKAINEYSSRIRINIRIYDLKHSDFELTDDSFAKFIIQNTPIKTMRVSN